MKVCVNIYAFLIFIGCFFGYGQNKEFNSAQVTINKFVEGILVTPYTETKIPLVIFIMDAGAINKDGNERMSKNDTFKKLAHLMAKKGIASFRYNKRIFKLERLGIKENEITVEDFVKDAKAVISYLKQNGNYKNITVIGHGQGSLIGMLASNTNVDAFISIAGYGQPIDKSIIEQLSNQAPGLDKKALIAFQTLKSEGVVLNYSPALTSIFRRDLQKFMLSWMQYDPSEIISNLNIPILILHGTKDIQITLFEAQKLKKTALNATLLTPDNMNHILREIKGGRLENQKSYNEAWRPLMPEAVSTIINFIHQAPNNQDTQQNFKN